MSDTSDTSDTSGTSTPELTRPVMVCLNDDGSYSAQSFTSDEGFRIRAKCLVPSRLVVPIVFVPGIMGTRLRVKGSQESAWFPPEGTWEKLVQALQYLRRNATERQRLLDPANTEVDDNGVAHPDAQTAVLLGDAPGKTDIERAKWRGWGQLHADSYGDVVATIERRFAAMFTKGEAYDAKWQQAVMDWQEPAKLGAQKPFAALDKDAVMRAASVFYPVHAVGYNWLHSNQASAKRLAAEIDRILDHYATRKKVCEKVIVVTHSMGGLVARACAQLPGMQEKILGILHGVMPALGAPATYKRMRSGFEGMGQVILGRDAAEATAVMTQAPGPLELLPTRQYRTQGTDGSEGHWLRVSHPQPRISEKKPDRTSAWLGDAADPYESIYRNNDEQSWWRLVKEELLNPAGRKDRQNTSQEAARKGKTSVEENDDRSEFKKYETILEQAKQLHETIEDKYHYNTYAYYAADIKQLSWNEVHWECADTISGDSSSAPLIKDDLNGTVSFKVGQHVYQAKIDRQRGPGDGTVPAESGAAPTPYAVQAFRHEGEATGHTSYDHQFSYKSDIGMATTLYAVTRMMADSEWLKSNLHQA